MIICINESLNEFFSEFDEAILFSSSLAAILVQQTLVFELYLSARKKLLPRLSQVTTKACVLVLNAPALRLDIASNAMQVHIVIHVAVMNSGLRGMPAPILVSIL